MRSKKENDFSNIFINPFHKLVSHFLRLQGKLQTQFTRQLINEQLQTDEYSRNLMFNSFPRMCLSICHICQLSHLTSFSLPACFSNMQRPLSTVTHLVGENAIAV